MKIAVIGATGMAGSRVTAEALWRGHDVTAVYRTSPPIGITGVRGDATDREHMSHLMSGMDAAVCVTRPRPGQEATVGQTMAALLDAAHAARVRLLIVGGASPLRSPEGVGLVLDDARYVPPHVRTIAAARGLVQRMWR